MDNKRKHELEEENYDIETAAELTPADVDSTITERDTTEGTGVGVTALILSLLSFFLFPLIMSLIAIVLGVIGGRKGSSAGWWAVGIGAFVFVIRIIAFPILAIF